MNKILSKNLVQIARILSDLEYHDGDAIGKYLGITRSAVWKSIKKLQVYGVEIISTKNKGYKLKEPLLLIDIEEIKKEVANSNIEIEVFENIDSTNDYLKKKLKFNKRQIAIAEMQNSGRGRMGRAWHSPFGKNIYFSYAYAFKKDISELNGLSLVVGIACLNAIKEIGIEEDIKLKWPNDGILGGSKLMGNLVELQSENYGYTIAIIGVGINVNMLEASEEITQTWTSLKKVTGKYIERTKLCIALIHNLNLMLEQFAKYGLQEFIVKWQELDSLYNKVIELNNGECKGVAKGINQQGNLILELDSGQQKTFSAGEVSISKR